MIWLKYIVPLLLWAYCSSQNVCEEPPEVDFAETVSDERAEYHTNDRVQYRCNLGYALEGPEWVTCEGPKWTSPPKCLAPCTITKQQLEAKNLFLSGGRRRSHVIPNDQTLEFQCREGYVLSAPSVRKCIDGHMDLPSCIFERGKNCSRPPTIKNGDIISLSQKQYTSGSSVEFKCQRYYAIQGESRSFCDNGNWTKAPVCLEPCVILLAEIGRRKLRSNESEPTLYLQRGDSVKLSCEPGSVLATNPSQSDFDLQCKEGPIVYPECKEIVCSPPAVNNGRANPPKQQYFNDETIEIQCDPGYKPEREATSRCTKNGWQPQPRCIKGCTVTEEDMRRNNIQLKWRSDPKLYTQSGNEIEFQCIPYYRRDPSSPPLRTRCIEGRVEYPRCIRPYPNANCSRPPGIQNGDVLGRVQAEYEPGARLRYQCQNLYIMKGSAEVRCENGDWTEPPTCIEGCTVTEEDMRRNNIQLKWRSDPKLYTQSGNEIEFQCIPYYRRDPSSPALRTRCIEGRVEYPRCIRPYPDANCGRPPGIQNGDVLGHVQAEYEPGARLRYQCQNLYVMNGAAEVRCENGDWTEPPTCIEGCTVTEEDMRHNNIQLKWRSDPKLYTQSGNEIEFQCIPYYRKDPSSPPLRTRCIEGRVEYPRCIRPYPNANCSRPPGIQNGDVLGRVQAEYEPGARLRYQCQNLYIMKGSAEVRCENGDWTEPPTCIEGCAVTEKDMRHNNIQLKWRSDPKLYTQSGDEMEFRCKPFYRRDPSSPPMRTQCTEGRVEYPRCIRIW